MTAISVLTSAPPSANARATRLLVALVAGLLLAACGSDGGNASSGDSDSGAASTDKKPWGAPCETDAECAFNLCLRNEYAPFGWCSAPCDTEAEPCAADENGTIGGWCARFPDDFATTPRQFCVPLCTTVGDCTTLSPLWETCDEPRYKGNVLYGSATGIRACQAPSQHGKEPVDTTSCADWATNYQSEFGTQVSVCRAYCDYLKTCQETADHYTEDCCGYGCILRMTPSSNVDTVYEKQKKCFVTSFSGHIGTAQVCSAPPTDCGATPDDPTPN